MPTPETSAAHYRKQQRLTAVTVAAARRQWRRLGEEDFDAAWPSVGGRLLTLTAAAQAAAAADGARYTAAAVSELGLPPAAAGEVDPQAFAGEASDGRPLESLLYQSVVAARVGMASGLQLPAALSAAEGVLDRIVRTQVADAARQASGVAIAARPGVTGYVRMLNLPSCERCAVLAGKWFKWNQGFARHPRCDCRHIPSSEDMAGDLRTDTRAAIEAGQVRGLSGADTKAILDGADPGQVINAKRGMYTADAFGRRLKATSEGITKRGVAGRRMRQFERDVAPGQRYRRSRVPRLRPEEIYRQAGEDRAEAIRLLDRFGYLNT